MDQITSTVNTYVVPLFAGEQGKRLIQHHRTSIAAAVALVSTYAIFRSITQVPRQLKHLPHLGFFDYIKAVVAGKTTDDIAHELTIPIAMQSKSGLYARFDRDGWSVHIVDPGAAKKFLFKIDIFPKTEHAIQDGQLIGRVMGTRHIAILNGHEWKTHRKVANPAFHRAMPINIFGQITHRLFKVMDDQLQNGPIEVHSQMTRWTLDALGLFAFDFDFNAVQDQDNEWVSRYNTVMTSAFDVPYLVFPSLDTWLLPFNPSRKQKHAEADKLLGMIDQIILEKRKTLQNKSSTATEKQDEEKDLLTMMIEAENSGEGVLTNQELRNNVVVFLIAGHDTTANALATLLYELAVNQDVQTRARKEAIRTLGEAQENIVPTAEQTRDMTYINMVIKENLRIHPPAPGTATRITQEDTELAGEFIPKGTPVVLDIHEMHHNPNIWSNPEEFKPERFTSGGEAEQLARRGIAWLTFSNGARQCLGMNFSLTEQRVLLPMLLRKYEWHLPENSIHKDKMVTGGLSLVTSPKDLQIVFKRRY
ncbi:cytochrome p450 [Lichtheimia corymbifera JMRC:FSU:9682]|uniref:Cytochrome p450 n=1 Tax=Lichtheimia corymbifera JMRC:FSU:9682 TaxID=1263082 RepID=A0A068RGZ8_9FUNG|nr:cytochrome p450 [Lichtheimia corymbifera JMRC:FSU:9682]